MNKKYVIGIVVVVILLLLVFFYFLIPGNSCKLKGGRIVNILGGESCGLNEINKGPVTGFKCPCICCVPSK